MKLGTTILCAGLALGLGGCVQVGPRDDKPLHIVMDVNIRIQVEKDVQNLWDSVEAMAEGEGGEKAAPEPKENG